MVAPKTSIGPYEVVSLLGTGGMGEVYRARDSRLRRDVALKMLPESLSNNPDRLARFEREAQVLAALNHPQVAAIYGLEESNGHRALVLELVEGETLAERIAAGPIPVADALPIAKQIAEALEYAHEHGVVHRDLKPSNVKIAPNGSAKVLDFGLAKLADGTVIERRDSSMSPTVADVTNVGVLMGTAAYMSPEQARRKEADKRSDVWAFGCVLYEMLTGRRAFAGDDVTEILANVLKAQPDWTRLPSETPAAIRRLLRRCLEKDRAQRWPDIASARFEIAEAMTHGDDVPAPPIVARRASWLPWTVAAVGLAAAVAAIGLWAPWRAAPVAAPTRMAVELGADAALAPDVGSSSVVMSPDGGSLAFVARTAGGSKQLFVRRLDQLQATALATLSNEDPAHSPFFSPDSDWIAFFAGGKLKKVAVSGGAAVTLADVNLGLGASWVGDTILFLAMPPGQLLKVSEDGGTPVPALKNAGLALWPQVLPGSDAVLFTAMPGPGAVAEANVMVQRPSDAAPRVLVRGAHSGKYVESGHLLYVSQGTVFAASFDLQSLSVGAGVPVIDGVQLNQLSGGSQFSVSRTGTLVFVPGSPTSVERPLGLLSQAGSIRQISTQLGVWGTPRFAPDGRRVAITRNIRGNTDVWTYDFERETLLPITVESGAQTAPVWTPDGRRIAYGSTGPEEGPPKVFWKRSDGTGEAQQLTKGRIAQLPSDWHPTKPILAFHDGTPPGAQRVMLLEIDGDEATGWRPREPTELFGGQYRNVMPVFSPDGKWIAYLSNKSNRFELYVRPFPGPGDEVLVSNGGANDPKWSKQRSELLYSTLGASGGVDAQLMVAPYTIVNNTFVPQKPRPWSATRIAPPPFGQFGFYMDLHPDGQRLAVATRPEAPTAAQNTAVIVFNFFEDLKRRVPAE